MEVHVIRMNDMILKVVHCEDQGRGDDGRGEYGADLEKAINECALEQYRRNTAHWDDRFKDIPRNRRFEMTQEEEQAEIVRSMKKLAHFYSEHFTVEEV